MTKLWEAAWFVGYGPRIVAHFKTFAGAQFCLFMLDDGRTPCGMMLASPGEEERYLEWARRFILKHLARGA